MLPGLVRRLFQRTNSPVRKPDAALIKHEAVRLNNEGKIREASTKFEEYLALVPDDIDALNDYGYCLVTLGRVAESAIYFDKAISLDDTHLPSVVNYANVLRSRGKSEESLALIKKAAIQAPLMAGVNAAYAATLFTWGDASSASAHSLRAWLGTFDTARSADTYLFTATYAEADERRLAAEHLFWARTLEKPAPAMLDGGTAFQNPRPLHGRRIRIGYWSPDLRNHSVRFFFRPLLEGHDKQRAEIFVFHDSFQSDEETSRIEDRSEHFFPVADLSDEALVERIRACELDVLVEMAGHTSTNRLNLFQARLAPLQVTGIGYPPTTGLDTIDIKLADPAIAHARSGEFHTEALAVLPFSFWCFDPLEDIPLPGPPPSERNGFVTFGCVGNLGKITEPVLAAWKAVLDATPGSRLQVRAVNFADPLCRDQFVARLHSCGIDAERVDIALPTGPRDLFLAYDQIDIVLDTFPFNGGTTSCFATYMGTPLVSLSGQATASRMGRSMLRCLGAPELAVDSWPAYVDAAVALARDPARLRQFKAEARALYKTTPLGNGVMFARQVEDLFLQHLTLPPVREQPPVRVAPLPEQELLRRAHHVYRYGNFPAAQRIVDYCLHEYPGSVRAHILFTQRLAASQAFGAAADYLAKQVQNAAPHQVFDLLFHRAKYLLLDGQRQEALSASARLAELQSNAVQALQTAMVRGAARVELDPASETATAAQSGSGPRHVQLIVPTGAALAFDDVQQALSVIDVPACVTLSIHQVLPVDRPALLQRLHRERCEDVIVIVHPNVRFFAPDLLPRVLEALVSADIVGIVGASAWSRVDWKLDRMFGSVIEPSGEKPDWYELHHMPLDAHDDKPQINVVGGAFIAMDMASLGRFDCVDWWDPLLSDGQTLMEEFFSWRAASAGARLAVHDALGVCLDWRVELPDEQLGQARLHLCERMDFDPLRLQEPIESGQVIPMSQGALAARLQRLLQSH